VLRVLLQLPTGAGKTFCFCRIAAGAIDKGRRVWLLGHRTEITAQISGALCALGIEHGVLEGGAKLVAVEHSKMVNQIRAMTYREACRFADTPERARMVAAVKGFKPGWAWYRMRELAGGGAA
jgi:superfamily II DNA or RNA helicase